MQEQVGAGERECSSATPGPLCAPEVVCICAEPSARGRDPACEGRSAARMGRTLHSIGPSPYHGPNPLREFIQIEIGATLHPPATHVLAHHMAALLLTAGAKLVNSRP